MKNHFLVILGACFLLWQSVCAQTYKDFYFPRLNYQALAGLSGVATMKSVNVYSTLGDIDDREALNLELLDEISDLFDQRIQEYGLQERHDSEFVVQCFVGGTKVVGGWVADWRLRLWKKRRIEDDGRLPKLLWESSGGGYYPTRRFPSKDVTHSCADRLIVNWLRANREAEQTE